MDSSPDILLFEPTSRNLQDACNAAAPARTIGWTLTVLFITAAIVCNAIVLTWINVAGGSWPQPATILGMALVFSQQGLVAYACGFGRQHFVFRTLLFVATATLSGMIGSRCIGRSEIQGSWVVMMLVHGVIVLAGAWYCRARGWRLVLAGEGESAPQSPWQFSLARLFAITTSAAIILGIVQQLRVEQRLILTMLTPAAILAVCCLICAWLGMTRQPWTRIVFTSFALVWVAAGIMCLNLGRDSFAPTFWLVLFNALFIFSAISIVRMAGYRIEPKLVTT